jgi:hypothetical protein
MVRVILTFAIEFTRIDFVEELHPHKRVENNSVVNRTLSSYVDCISRRNIEPSWTEE